VGASSVAAGSVFRSERFDLRKLFYFTKIVEIGSISKASVELGIAQPALSKSIRLLEFDLRTSLLQRSPKGVRPTKSGHRLYEHCKTVFRQLELARAEIQGTGDMPMGSVILGMPYSVNLFLAAPLLSEALARFPGIDLQIVESRSVALTEDILSDRIDLSLMVPEGNPHPGIKLHELIEEDYLLIRPPGGADPACPRDRVRMAEVADRPVILPAGQGRRIIEERFARRGHRLSSVREIETLSMILHCVEVGLGEAILPAGWASTVDADRLTKLGFDDPLMTRRLSLCHAASRPLSLPALQITKLIRQVTAGLIADGRWRGARLVEPAPPQEQAA
jgi:LysR family nitrogen assimilation transcriptional regulator